MYRITNKNWTVTKAICIERNEVTLELKTGEFEKPSFSIEGLIRYVCAENSQVSTDSGAVLKRAKVDSCD